uniref:DinB family protein n=1 Tax=Thermorudis peleae TaxID=1382356 RepID=A0A831TFB6_9BACT
MDERAELIETYQATPVTLRALLRGITDEQARQRPSEDEWSIVEVVAHLGDAEERAHERVRRMLQEEHPFLPAYDPAVLAEQRGYRSMSLAAALERFERLRAEHVATLARLDATGWARTGQHEETGTITVESLTRHMVAHDAIHLAQMARIITTSVATRH